MVTPLLSLSGSNFETGIETDLGKRFRSVHFAEKYKQDHNRPANNAEVVAEAKKLVAGKSALLFQARLEAELHGWRLRGDVDLMRLERATDGTLHVLIGDMKSTTDPSLLPYMTGTEKEALRRAGVTTVQQLATLKDFAPSTDNKSTELVPAPGREAQVKQIAATWSVGPRLDELVHRARSFRRSVRKDGTQALSYIPGKGNSSLPVSKPDLNPNLVTIYLDAQQDYLEGRVYLLGALVVACKDGSPVGRRAVVRLSDGPTLATGSGTTSHQAACHAPFWVEVGIGTPAMAASSTRRYSERASVRRSRARR
jgi:hypothetical protein